MANAMVESRRRHKILKESAREFIRAAAEFVPEPMRERARELVETL